jgi:hypothetical protein
MKSLTTDSHGFSENGLLDDWIIGKPPLLSISLIHYPFVIRVHLCPSVVRAFFAAF